MSKANDFFDSIRRTAEDLTTLEINTIIKDEMNCIKPTDNNRLALYQLAKRYSLRLEELGDKYYHLISSEELRENFETKHRFMLASRLRGGGIFSFRELSILGRIALDWLNDNHEHFTNSARDRKRDCQILQRVELKSEEIRIMLEDNYQDASGNPFLTEMRKHYLEVKKKQLPPLEQNHAIYERMAGSPIYGFREETKEDFMGTPFSESTACIDKLDLRDKMLIRKSLDLGTEQVVMQTRISMDGDITTRLAQKFADTPNPFVMNIHHNSVDMSVSYWQKLFDALVTYGGKIIDKLPKLS